MNKNDLKSKFRHNTWFKGENLTIKQFLDYVLAHRENFKFTHRNHIYSEEEKNRLHLGVDVIVEYTLHDMDGHWMKLSLNMSNYLAKHRANLG